ncbi:MAG: glycosyltransferase family 39 protein [Patescibacteria group bacterium]
MLGSNAALWVRKNPAVFVALLGILLLGGFLRFSQVGSLMHFSGDEARDAFLVRSIARDGDVQLLGAGSSIGDGTFKLGPAFLYMLVPAYALTGNNPAGGAWTVAILAFASIFLVYLLGKRLFSTRVGLIAALLYSVSYLVAHYGRWQWNPNPAPFFMLLLLLGIHALAQPGRKHATAWVAVVGLCTGVLLQLHATAIFVLPPLLFLLCVVLKIRLRWWQVILGLGLVGMLQLPQLIYDLQHNFEVSHGLWQIIHGSSTHHYDTIWRMQHTIKAFHHFFNEAIFTQQLKPLALALMGLGTGVLAWRTIRGWRQPAARGNIILLAWLLVPFVVYHAFTSVVFLHYFALLFPLPFLIVAAGIDWLWQQGRFRALVVPLIVLAAGFAFWQSANSFAGGRLRAYGEPPGKYALTLQQLQAASAYIIQDAAGQPFRISTEPFPYEKSMWYLLDQAGTPPVENAQLRYTLVYGTEPDLSRYLRRSNIVIWMFENYVIIKQQVETSTQ